MGLLTGVKTKRDPVTRMWRILCDGELVILEHVRIDNWYVNKDIGTTLFQLQGSCYHDTQQFPILCDLILQNREQVIRDKCLILPVAGINMTAIPQGSMTRQNINIMNNEVQL